MSETGTTSSTNEGTPAPDGRRLLYPFLLLLLFFATFNTTRFAILDDRPRIDLRVFLLAGQAVDEGISPYRESEALDVYYVYPQAWAWMMVPLSRMSTEQAEAIWHFLSGFFLLVIVAVCSAWAWRTGREDGLAGGNPGWAVLAGAALIGVGFSPVQFGWQLGQADLLVTTLLAVGLFLLRGPYLPYWAGLLVGLAVVAKFSPLLLVPALALALGWRFVGVFAGVSLVYIAALAIRGVLGEEIYYLTEQVPFHQFRSVYPANSIHHLLCVHLWGDHFVREDGYYDGWLTTLVTAITLGSYAAAGLWLWWRRAGLLALVTVAVAFSHLASPFLEPHHYTSSILVYTPWFYLLVLRRDVVPLILLSVGWLIGGLFMMLYGGFGGWTWFLLLLTDLPLIAVALMRPQVGGTSPYLLERNRAGRLLGEQKQPHPAQGP
ncbi:MAG: DUF2029 domain-containing protein [Candidatus Sumerlaeia bacterium]|nr:DUF2029 domain-containing protein [Candidatus Sumerlaeia bacterium]